MTQKFNYGKNMILFSAEWNGNKSFRMMPVTSDCPYNEVIYDPATTLLVVISKFKLSNFQFVPKLDDHGEPVPVKRPRPSGTPYRETRILMDKLQEYYIDDIKEQEKFIKEFAVNADEFDYKKYLRDLDKESMIHKLEVAPIVDKDGKTIKINSKKK